MAMPAAPQRDPDLTTVIAHIEGLAQSEFWGFFTLKFEKGKIVHLREERNIRPADLTATCGTQPKKTGENYVNREEPSNRR